MEKHTVLVVDDDGRIRVLIGEMLRAFGYEVVLADGAEAALSTFAGRGSKIDLVLSDVCMPGMRGPEMVAILRHRYPALRCLFMTGSADWCGDGEVVLSKPFSMTELRSAIDQALNSRGAGQPLIPATAHGCLAEMRE